MPHLSRCAPEDPSSRMSSVVNPPWPSATACSTAKQRHGRIRGDRERISVRLSKEATGASRFLIDVKVMPVAIRQDWII